MAAALTGCNLPRVQWRLAVQSQVRRLTNAIKQQNLETAAAAKVSAPRWIVTTTEAHCR